MRPSAAADTLKTTGTRVRSASRGEKPPNPEKRPRTATSPDIPTRLCSAMAFLHGQDPTRTLRAPPELKEKLNKIGARIVTHARYVTFQMAEVAVPRELFQEILRLIDGLRQRPAPA
jgi:hypothetical protein